MEIKVQFAAALIPLTLVQACGCHRWVLGAGSRANGHLVGLMMFKYAVIYIYKLSNLLEVSPPLWMQQRVCGFLCSPRLGVHL